MPEGADPGLAEAELQKLRLVGNCLNAVEACDAQEKRKRSLALASALETSLLNTWNAKPEDFTKGQFLYR